MEVDGYTDADWASNPNDRRSTAGYFTFVGGNLVTWRSKKQRVVALSSAEAEFRGITSGITEILWLRRLLTEIGFPPKGEVDSFVTTRPRLVYLKIPYNTTGPNMWRSIDISSRKSSIVGSFNSLSYDRRNSWLTY